MTLAPGVMALLAHFKGKVAPGVRTISVGRVRRPLVCVALLATGVAKLNDKLLALPLASAKRNVKLPVVPV